MLIKALVLFDMLFFQDLPGSSKPMKETRSSQKKDTEKTKLSSPDADRKALGRTISEPKQSRLYLKKILNIFSMQAKENNKKIGNDQ